MSNLNNAVIEFSEEQSMLLDTAMDFCKSHSPIDKVRSQIEEAGFDESQWQEMVELGWTGITIPESYGGLGLRLADVVPIIESMGRHLMASPFFATTLASQALIHGGSEAQKNHYLPKIAAGSIATLAILEEEGDWDLEQLTASAELEDGNVILSGKKTLILDAAAADLIIASVMINGEPSFVCIDATSIDTDKLKREVLIDETRRGYELVLDGITLPESAILANNCFKAVENAALLMLSAEMCGGIAGTLNTIVDYLNTRKQFERYIGSYQALKHPTVDILLGLEATRSHVYHAASLFDSGDAEDVNIALSMCKAVASEHFAFAGDRAIQFHGGFGFTYECDAQLFLRRALWSQYQFGDEKHHRQKLAQLIFDQEAL